MLKQRTKKRLSKLERVLAQRQKDITLILANIHDPHNVSAIYRSADAFGIATIHLYYTNTAFPKLGSKSSASGKKWVDSIYHTSLKSLTNALVPRDYQIVATSCTTQAQPLLSYDFTKPTAIIMGNEHSGVPPELSSVVTNELYIPMYGMIQSFNVSVAAAIILAEASRQRAAMGMYDISRYTKEEYEEKLMLWMNK